MGGGQLIAAQFDHDDGFFTSGQSAYFYGKYELVNWDVENMREAFLNIRQDSPTMLMMRLSNKSATDFRQ